MKPKRKVQSKQGPAKVISLAAYRNAHRRPVPESTPQPDTACEVSLMGTYCRWLALVGAAWAFWW